ncbi:hypothetical protein [Haloprofundus halobius]|nr:hypothetical protein [Haloprofundus halobius]
MTEHDSRSATSPGRLADAVVGTPWRVADVRRRGDGAHYRVVLETR